MIILKIIIFKYNLLYNIFQNIDLIYIEENKTGIKF